MPDTTIALAVTWLLSYLLHSSVLLGLLWGAERLGGLRRLPRAGIEWLWRAALLGGLLTASLQTWQSLPGPAPAAAETAETAEAAEAAKAAKAATVARPAPAAPLERHADGAAEPREPVERTQPQPAARVEDSRLLTVDQPLARHAALLATLLWGLVAGVGLLLLPLHLAWLHRLVRRLPLNEDPALQRFNESLCRRAGLRAPRLRTGSRWNSPLLAPGGQICLPTWFSQALSPAQREVVLAHELAHLQRHDPAWRLAGQIVARLGFMQPLNALALRRLDALAELACDDWAARMTGGAQALAESLYVCAAQLQKKQLHKRHSPALAAAMASPDSPLLQRMRSLLEEPRMEEVRKNGRRVLWLALGGVAMAALLLPAVIVRNVSAEGGPLWNGLGRVMQTLHLDGSNTRIVSRGPDGRMELRLRGKVEFNEAEDDVQSLDGSLDLEGRHEGRQLHLRLDSAGDQAAIERSFTVDGQAAQPNASQQRWIALMMGRIADIAVDNDKRVRKLYAQGGVDAVLANAERSDSDFVRRRRIEALLGLGKLDAAATDRVLALSTRIDSDFERRQLLQALIQAQPLGDGQQLTLLQSTARIDSDFERRNVLETLSPTLSAAAPVMDAWLATVRATGSAFEGRAMITALLQRKQLAASQLDAALQASEHLDSDFEHRGALETIARRLDASQPAQLQAYGRSAARIDSDFERRSALLALIQAQAMDKAASLVVLDAAAGISSDFERVTVLKALADKMPGDAELLARYRQLARSLGDFERGQAEKALDHLQST